MTVTQKQTLQILNTSTPRRATMRESLSVTLALVLGMSGAPGWGATIPNEETFAADDAVNPTVNPTVNPAAPASRNAAGERAKPRVKRPPAKQNELYTPIKKPDDSGQIPEIDMFVGESRVFPTPGVARIAVGNGQIMTASALDDKEVIIFANGAGTSTLFVWHEDGRYQRVKVNIVQGDTSRIAREVAAFLGAIPKAKASIVGDKVIVEGDELSDADRDKVIELAKRYPQIVNFTSTIGWEQMVMMDVKVVEFPKTELRELGLKWNAAGGGAIGGIWSPGGRGDNSNHQINIATGVAPPITAIGGTGPVLLPSALTILSGINLGLNGQLNFLEQNGKASILAEPQLSTRSGFKASFLAGGEFPYSVATINGVTVYFKPYGIKLDIEPRIGRNGVIRAIVDSEVSSIDASITTTGGPALLTRKTRTEFNVRNGETIVLSGLLQRNTSTDIDKVPLLGNIPILGALFRSKRFQNKETELVVFVTPTIVDSRAPGLVDRVERATQRLGENLGKSPYLSEPLQPGSDAARFDQAPPEPKK
jgi:pilus assembly protein CpaC